MLTGDTWQANGTATAGGGLLRFKEYGLVFKSPFWFSKKWVINGDPIYDETVLLAALNGPVQIKLSTTDGIWSKRINVTDALRYDIIDIQYEQFRTIQDLPM